MEFLIDRHSSAPAVHQIKEQVRLAVAMGILRTGDTLPSIRDVEKQTGINRGQIHRAYSALRNSGLLALTRGKGTAVAAAAISPHPVNGKCQQLSRSIISKVRRLGVSPTAFARYLGQHAQRIEHHQPFIAYVDPDEEIAAERAAEVSRLWEVLVAGLTVPQLKMVLRRAPMPRKILVNHLLYEHIRSKLRDASMEMIPIKIHYTRQTVQDLAGIRPDSSVLVVLPPHALHSARFIVERLHEWIKSPTVRISWISVLDAPSFDELLSKSPYDYVIVTPGARSKVPLELRRNASLILLRMQLDVASLEAARIRAGVII